MISQCSNVEASTPKLLSKIHAGHETLMQTVTALLRHGPRLSAHIAAYGEVHVPGLRRLHYSVLNPGHLCTSAYRSRLW